MKRIREWYPSITLLVLLCLLALAGLVHNQPTAAQQPRPSPRSTFDFDRFTKSSAFRLNTLPTTPYGPPWADVIMHPANMVQCSGAAIALCYYSGPGPTAPCIRDGLGIANCTCYEIPAGQPYMVDINAILNLHVYLQTVAVCGKEGRLCLPNGNKTAPVCDAINKTP